MAILRTLTAGSVSGTGTVTSNSAVLGGVLITTDGTNAATVVVKKDSASGDVVYEYSSALGTFHVAPILAAPTIYYSITGTGASAELYEWER